MRKCGARTVIGSAAFAAFALLLSSAGAGTSGRAVSPQDLRDAIGRQIQRRPADLMDKPGPRAPQQFDPKIARLYQDREMNPYWVTPAGPDNQASIVRYVLGAADSQGLNAADYAVEEIGRLWTVREAEGLARLELLLTLELAAYASDLVEGRHQPRDFDPDLFPTACDCELDTPALLERALAAPDLKAFFEEQAPPFAQYRGLRDKLAEYRAIAVRGGWPQVPPGDSLKPGAKDPRVPGLRRRLAVTGEWPVDEPDGRTDYDPALVEAVKRFQRHHGLDPDGVVGPATLEALNVPVERRIRQLIVNMESWRWVGRDPGDWWLEVNIPSFRLTALRGGKSELTMTVIVGDEFHMTPVFGDRLRYVEFNPYWNVPLSIAQKEFLPALRKDPSFLKKNRIRMFQGWDDVAPEADSTAIDWSKVVPDDMGRYRLRQDSGPDDSLGTVAFMFPNAFGVYLHDTPALGLFQSPKRTFSHGCIRVSKAHELAAYVLGGPDKGWDEKKVLSTIADGQNRSVRLDVPVPIYILYNTAVVDPEGHDIYFLKDVYGRDALLEKAIF
jgi:murein L,D-transpeptidase YcbB/YkuD